MVWGVEVVRGMGRLGEVRQDRRASLRRGGNGWVGGGKAGMEWHPKDRRGEQSTGVAGEETSGGECIGFERYGRQGVGAMDGNCGVR